MFSKVTRVTAVAVAVSADRNVTKRAVPRERRKDATPLEDASKSETADGRKREGSSPQGNESEDYG